MSFCICTHCSVFRILIKNRLQIRYSSNPQSVFICFCSAFVALFCVPVWLLPSGKTIGKLCLGISVLDSKENIQCSKRQLAIRQASLLLVELGLSMILMFIPLFITIGMVVFSQKKIALHDYFALSYTIDDKGTLTFKTKEELEEYIKEKNKPYYQNDTYTKSAK